ncbi:MAG: LL-diaminopimelate aminotransferase [Dehalococcoidia bacterium]|nr:LL-diaminopimelate aminotransferase [Dehalococcoidia bacterium]
MNLSRRLDKIPPYLFVEINKKIAAKKAEGIDIISFAIGDPDGETPAHIIEYLCKVAHDPANHHYPETFGLPELCKAIAGWYKRRFNVELDPAREVLPLIGSKEGIGHMSFCLLDPGDIALVTDPGYPVYSISCLLAGGEIHYLKLNESSGFLPDLDAIHADVLKKAKVLWISYPNNPTGAVAELDFFSNVVAFAKKNDIAVCHDAPYTEVAFDGYRPHSFLEVPGAKDIGVEFHSLSKTYNMTGWRIGMVVGNQKMVDGLFRFKSNIDSGIPQAIQLAAIEALTGSQDEIPARNMVYQARRDKIVNALNELGLKVTTPKAGFYIWARVPEGYTSVSFVAELLDKVGVAVTPGTGYGKSGEGYVRLSITQPDDKFDEGVRRLLTLKKA